MPSIAETWVTVAPETRKLAEGIRQAFRDLDPTAREAGSRWGREIEQGIGKPKVELKADTTKAKAEIDEAARDRHSTVHVGVDNSQLGTFEREVSSAITQGGQSGIAGLQPALMGVGVTMLAGIASAFSGLAGLIPAGLLGAGGVIGTLAVGLDGVKDAYDAVNKAAQSSGQDQATRAREVTTAQRGLTDAVQSQAQAQRDVANAYKDARNQLDDLNLSLQGGKISEAQAYNDVLKARRDLARGGFTDTLDYNDAVLRVQSAEQTWQESKQRNVELQEKANDANAKGVAGSDLVTAAQERRRRADESVATAQDALNVAQNKTSDSAKSALQAMSMLSPQAQNFVNTLMGMKPAFQDFKNSIQDALFANIGPQFQQLATTYLPVLQGLMSGMATTMNQAFGQLSKFLMQPQTLQMMQSIFANVGQSFQVWTQALQPATEAFLKFAQVGSGFLPQLAQMGVQAANMFNQFAQSGQLQQWMQTGMNALGELGKMLPTIMQMFGDLAPIGMATLQGLNQVLTALQPAIAPLAGLLGAFISNGLAPMLTLIAQVATTIVQGLAPALTQWFNAMGPVAQQLMGALQPILQALGPVLSQIANEIGGALIGAVQQLVPVIIPLVQQIAQWYATMLPLLPQLLQLGLQLLPVITSALTVIIPPFTKLLEILTNLASAILPTVTSGLKSFTGAFSTAFNTVKSVVEEAWKVIGPIFDKIEGFLSMIPGPLQKLIGLDSQGGQGGTVLRSPIAPSVPGSPGTSTFPSTPGGPAAGGIGAGTANSGLWDKVAAAESSGNWSNADTGKNGHYGGLQFSPDTWKAYGGLEFAPMPNQASPEQQKIVADRTAFSGYNGTPPQGLGAWETITNGSVPGVTTSTPAAPALAPTSPPPVIPSAPGLPDAHGAHSQIAQIAAIAEQFGLKLTAGRDDHSADGGFHPLGEAGDFSNGSGNTPQEEAFAEYMKKNFGPMLAELIYSDPNTPGVLTKNGRDAPGTSVYDAGTLGMHQNHVHVAVTDEMAAAFQQAIGGAAPGAAMTPPTLGGSPVGNEQDPLYVQLPASAQQGNSGAGQLGQDFLGGILQEFGMDGSVFKDPTQFGLFKIFKGLMGLKVKGGDGASSAAPGGGGGGASGLLGGLLNGIVPNAMGPLKSGSPADAPGEFMPMMPGSGGTGGINFPSIAANGQPGVAGPGNVDNSITVNGVQNPGPAFDAANQANVPRMRQQLRPLPG